MNEDSNKIYFIMDDTNSVTSIFQNKDAAEQAFAAVVDKTKYKLKEVSLIDLVRSWCDKARNVAPEKSNVEQTVTQASISDAPITRIDVKILRAIQKWPRNTPITYPRIARSLEIGESTAARKLRNLRRLRIIDYVEGDCSTIKLNITPMELEALKKETENYAGRCNKNISIRG